MINTAGLQAKLLRQGASDHLDRGDIDRNGWPASARLATICDLSKQLFDNVNIARLSPDLQSDVDTFKRMEALAEEEQVRMDELIGKQQQGFDHLDVAQGHVEALLAQLRSSCCGSIGWRMLSPACVGMSLCLPYSSCAIRAMSLTLVSCLASRSSSRARVLSHSSAGRELEKPGDDPDPDVPTAETLKSIQAICVTCTEEADAVILALKAARTAALGYTEGDFRDIEVKSALLETRLSIQTNQMSVLDHLCRQALRFVGEGSTSRPSLMCVRQLAKESWPCGSC